jgi:hypothetical protein
MEHPANAKMLGLRKAAFVIIVFTLQKPVSAA